VNGFEYVLVNGVPTAVSASNPLTVTIAGVANTVTGVNTGTSTLTLGTARVDVVGDAVVAANAPVTIRADRQHGLRPGRRTWHVRQLFRSASPACGR
jgi:hypothetical protein